MLGIPLSASNNHYLNLASYFTPLMALITVCVFMNPAFAACICRCVDGSMQPICSNTIEVPPICPPTVCQIVPPSVQPIAPPIVPPIGTNSCQNQQVLNPYTNQYEWKLICR